MRTVAAVFISLTLLACAHSNTAEPDGAQPGDGDVTAQEDPSAQPAEVEGPAPTTESAVAIEEGLCTLGPVAEWSACDGQRVQLRGRAANDVSQHPIVAQPEAQHQGYMNAEGVQLIVVTKQPFGCDAMRVVGTLRSIDLGGEPGTKRSYSGWSIDNAEVTCE